MTIEAYWQLYLESLPVEKRKKELIYETWHFCDNEKDANICAELVCSGEKTATTSLLWEYETEHEPLPQVGDVNIITTWDGQPACIIQTTQVNILPFNEVDAQFAFDEGEGDKSLDFWRKVHWKVFSKICPDINKCASEDMPVVCERFAVIYP